MFLWLQRLIQERKILKIRKARTRGACEIHGGWCRKYGPFHCDPYDRVQRYLKYRRLRESIRYYVQVLEVDESKLQEMYKRYFSEDQISEFYKRFSAYAAQ